MKAYYRSKLFECTIIFGLAFCTGVIFNSLYSRRISLIFTPITAESGKIIELQEARQYHIEGQAIFIDTRETEEYHGGHIRGAVSIPITASRTKKMEVLMNIPRDQLIITYCDGSDCNSSLELAHQLIQVGFENVLIFFDGWNKWINATDPMGSKG